MPSLFRRLRTCAAGFRAAACLLAPQPDRQFAAQAVSAEAGISAMPTFQARFSCSICSACTERLQLSSALHSTVVDTEPRFTAGLHVA